MKQTYERLKNMEFHNSLVENNNSHTNQIHKL